MDTATKESPVRLYISTRSFKGGEPGSLPSLYYAADSEGGASAIHDRYGHKFLYGKPLELSPLRLATQEESDTYLSEGLAAKSPYVKVVSTESLAFETVRGQQIVPAGTQGEVLAHRLLDHHRLPGGNWMIPVGGFHLTSGATNLKSVVVRLDNSPLPLTET